MFDRTRSIFLFFLLLFCQRISANNDSLWQVANSSTLNDTDVFYALDELTWITMEENLDSALSIGLILLERSKQKENLVYQSKALNSIGAVQLYLGNLNDAIIYFEKSKGIDQLLGNELDVATGDNNLGALYNKTGNYVKAIEHYHSSLKVYERLNNKDGLATIKANLGLIYRIQGEHERALKYMQEALELEQDLNKTKDVIQSYSNIGIVHLDLMENKKALTYFKKAFDLSKTNNLKAEGSLMNNLGITYQLLSLYDSAKYFHDLALENGIAQNRKEDISSSMRYLGKLANKKGNYTEGIEWCSKALTISKEIQAIDRQQKNCECLFTAYEQLNDHKNALKYYKQMTALSDSLFNQDKSKEIGRIEGNYEFEKKVEEEKREAENLARVEQEKKTRRDNIQFSGILVFVLLLFVVVFMSGKFSMSEKVAEGLIFFTFLLFFEFLLVVGDPYIEVWANEEPVFKLLINALLAALIFPLHAFFENTLKKRVLTKKG